MGADAAWAEAYVRAAASNQTCSVAAMTRAGEYLLRGGLTNAAVAAARDVTSRARSLLPAYLLGLRCAMGTGDRAWALDCTRRAIDASIRPLPALYREMVRIKTSDGAVASDSEMVQALKALRADEPDNPLWAQMLSLARFKRGGWEVVDAMEQANAAIQSGAANRSSFILAAEASRLLRNHDRAADILHRGLTRFPGDPTLLNNLAYTLAMTPAGLAEAQALLPDLRRLEKRAPTGLRDTIVTVLIRAGRLDEAERALTEDTAKPAAGSPDAFRRDLHQAEIAWGRRQFEAAQRLLRDILTGSRDVPDEEILNANALLGKVDEALSAGGRTNAAPQPAQAALLRPEATESTARRRRATE